MSSSTYLPLLPIQPTASQSETWSLMELQGSLAPPPPSSAEAAMEPVLLGDIHILPNQHARRVVSCKLVIGTLSVTGEIVTMPKTMALIARKKKITTASHCRSLPSSTSTSSKKRRRHRAAFKETTGGVEHHPRNDVDAILPLRLFRSLDDDDDEGCRSSSSSDTEEGKKEEEDDEKDQHYYFETLQLLTERYLFRGKPVRSVSSEQQADDARATPSSR